MTNASKATQIKAVEKILSLRKNGVSMIAARKIVALEFDTTVYKVTQWQRQHGPKTGTSKTNNVVVSPRKVPATGLNTLSETLFDTIEELRTGKISCKEASAMSSLAGNITNIKKLQFAAHKYAVKTANKGMSIDKLLNQ
tara:strand:+ start:106 stop:525 length:420 start_codon:yes stop_codon:yes gene_type:complete